MKYNLKNKSLNENERMTRSNFCAQKFKEFCKRTDLHGFKYITMDGLSVTERSVWAVTVVVSTICATFLVVTAYRWYARNPIVTVVETTQGVIWDIPFPAVTICDLNIVSRKAAENFSKELVLPENITLDFVMDTFKLAPLLHSMNKAEPDQIRDLRVLQTILDINLMSIETLFRKLSPASICSNLMERCMWKNTIYHCNQIFRHVFVAVNLCCTFNYYAVDDVNHELNVFHFPTPRRVASCGYQTALTVITKTDPSDYYSTSFASFGSLVFVDDAYNVPDQDSPMRLVKPSAELGIAVSPERTYATPGIKSFSVQERQCYYTDEITLPNFKQYSFHNCMAVRKVQILIKKCNCVPFYFPKKDRNRICNFHDIVCLEAVMNMTSFGESDDNKDAYSDDETELIECLPECEHFSYPLQVAMGTISDHVPLTGIDFYKDVDLKNRSVVNIFFNDLVATRYRRDAYLNWQNILAAFGGLLSLMLGFTLVSLFDFILFFTLRVLYDSFIRFFKSANLQEREENQDYFIKFVEEQKKYGRVRPANFTTPKYLYYKELERKQADDLLFKRVRF